MTFCRFIYIKCTLTVKENAVGKPVGPKIGSASVTAPVTALSHLGVRKTHQNRILRHERMFVYFL